MKSFFLALMFVIFLSYGVNALIAEVSDSKIEVNTEVGKTEIRSIGVKNTNPYAVGILAEASGDPENEIRMLGANFLVVFPNWTGYIPFTVKVNQTGTYKSKVNLTWYSDIEEDGVSVFSEIIIVAEEPKFEQLNSRVSILEAWKYSISQTIAVIQDFIADNYINYFKYLSSSDRKKIVCGYAEENNFTHIEDLGYNCNLTYKQYKSGEKASCKCRQI